MKVVKTINEVRDQVKKWRSEGLTVGLVPTMGYLHEGHASLIDRSVKDNDRTVVQILQLLLKLMAETLFSILNRMKCIMMVSHLLWT